MHKILSEDGERIRSEDDIAQIACAHFRKIFTGEENINNEDTLECIPRMVIQEPNTHLISLANMEKLKSVIFSMKPIYATGPDGMNGYFFQKCWHIIKHDLMGVVNAFISGQMIPKYFSHSCIILLPKVSNLKKFNEFRPISLSNFTCKIISKLVNTRVRPILSSSISSNRSGFVEGRSISENIILTQEIIHRIKKPNIGSNFMIKLCMAKSFDTVSWSYI